MRKTAERFKFSLRSNTSNEHFTWKPACVSGRISVRIPALRIRSSYHTLKPSRKLWKQTLCHISRVCQERKSGAPDSLCLPRIPATALQPCVTVTQIGETIKICFIGLLEEQKCHPIPESQSHSSSVPSTAESTFPKSILKVLFSQPVGAKCRMRLRLDA